MSRPHANVSKLVVKFPMYAMSGSEIFGGRLVEMYDVDGDWGSGSGTEYATAGQYGSECTKEQANEAAK